STSTDEIFFNPFLASGATLTCHGHLAKVSFHSVIGAISLSDNLPTESELNTTAGRFLRISSPMAGSKDTSQISPLLMDRGSIFNDVSPLPCVAIRVGLRIVLYRFFGRRFQNAPPLVKRELEQSDWIGRSC